jgi:hypothetical protein
VVVNHGTGDPGENVKIAESLRSLGASYLDAPVSGGGPGAKARTLTTFVGGDQGPFERCSPVFATFSTRVSRMGPVGSGQMTKLLNNAMTMSNLKNAVDLVRLAQQLTEPALLLDADRSGPVAHTAVISQVDPTRAPAGRVLISSTVLGVPPAAAHLDATVRAQLARLYGTSTTRWELLTVHHDPEAVPAMPPPHDLRRPVRLLAGLYVCGDHRDTSTVQGALHSARRAAHALLRDLGAQPVPLAEPLEAAA